jgi:hypothetical protein
MVPKTFRDVEAGREEREKLFKFIEGAIASHRSVLVLSDTNQFRSAIVAAFYIIKKYRWSAGRALEFILSKKEDIQITEEMLSALKSVEADLVKEGKGQPFLLDWTSEAAKQKAESEERRLDEVSLINSFVNSIF